MGKIPELKFDTAKSSVPGDFRAVVDAEAGVVWLPQDLSRVCRWRLIDGLPGLLSEIRRFPDAVLAELPGWSRDDLQKAEATLREQLEGSAVVDPPLIFLWGGII